METVARAFPGLDKGKSGHTSSSDIHFGPAEITFYLGGASLQVKFALYFHLPAFPIMVYPVADDTS